MNNLLATFTVFLSNETEFLFKNDKIYTVLVVSLIIFTGLLVYLFITESKVRRLEKKVDELKKENEQ